MRCLNIHFQDLNDGLWFQICYTEFVADYKNVTIFFTKGDAINEKTDDKNDS